MLGEIIHVGITVKDMEASIKFYRDVLGLTYRGSMVMEGEETDRLFRRKNTRVAVAYLNGSDHIMAPPVELLEFLDGKVEKAQARLDRVGISEICFRVQDIGAFYKKLLDNQVECLSEPQFFDFTKEGFGKSKALYFRDPDGVILEAIEEVE